MSNSNEDSNRVKVDDLSFYSATTSPVYSLNKKEPGFIEQNVKMLREIVLEGVGLVRQGVDTVNHVVDTGVAHSSTAYYQLQEEDNLPARIGVISATGLLGLLVGVRRGR